MRKVSSLTGLLLASWQLAPAQAVDQASYSDLAFRNGVVYTVDRDDSVREALAVRDGRIVYVGTREGLASFVGPKTKIVDLKGRMLMPGLVDGHMHPLSAGSALLKCNLNYERLTVPALQAKVQACLDASRDLEPDHWLEVVNWFQEGMLPAGTLTSSATLDVLKTRRPILISSSFGHSSLANSRAVHLAGITAKTPDPLGGKINRDASGNPTGLLDDAAQDPVHELLPKPTPADDAKAAKTALDAMRKQGITTFLDATGPPSSLAAFARLQRDGTLSARAHFAPVITPPEGRDPKKPYRR